MKRATALLIAIYGFLIIPLMSILGFVADFFGDALNARLILWWASLAFLCVMAGINIGNAIRLRKAGDYNTLRNAMRKVKLGSIPFFIGNLTILLCEALLYGLASLPFVWMGLPAVIYVVWLWIVIGVSYSITPMSSMYGIAFIQLLKKEKKISAGMRTLYILLQICPALDIISTVFLLIKYKKEETENVADKVQTGNL